MDSAEIYTNSSSICGFNLRYFDPQYFLLRQLTTASDVYSFGVVLLELITGRKAIEFHCPAEEECNLVEWVRNYFLNHLVPELRKKASPLLKLIANL